MTSDAKVGLLLGLVFIFLIAFLLHGLPGFRNSDTNSELTTNMLSSNNKPSGLAEIERKINRRIVASPQTVSKADHRSKNDLSELTSTRYQMQLPVSAELIRAGRKVVSAKESTESVKKRTTLEKTIAPKGKAKLPKVYVVCAGDNLASIAAKFYGSRLGNKTATVKKIYATNKSNLHSPDELYIGQKLIIPALSDSAPTENSGSSTLLASMFGKVKSAASKKHRIYTVKSGDNLWQIASDRLGSGSRYKEIIKLNSRTLADEYFLKVGMELKLPGK